MAVPVELEIFIKNSTNAGLQSVENNVSNVENQTKQLIAALQQVIAEQKNSLKPTEPHLRTTRRKRPISRHSREGYVN
ncbi:MAG: hypothetical protein LUH12_05630 [Bacteroides sp.]|nr:hypothetical protein [Bacteroides sp.]